MSTTPNDSIDPEVERLAAELAQIGSRAEPLADWPRWSDLTWELKEELIADAVIGLKIRREHASFTALLERASFQGDEGQHPVHPVHEWRKR